MKTKHKRPSTSSAEPEHNDSPRRSPGQSRSRTSRSSSPRQRKRSFSRSVSTSPRRGRSRSRSDSPHNGYENGRRNRSKSRSRSPMSNRRRHLGSRDNPNPSRCLGVFGLSIYTSERQITSIFSKFGPLEKVQVVLDAKTQKSRGFAFVYFESIKDSTEAKNECSGMEVDGRRIRVDYSITQRPHTPTPGIYMGKPESLPPNRGGGGSNRSYGRGGGDGHYRDRFHGRHRRSPSPYYHRQRSSRRDYHDRGYDRSYDRYDRNSHYDRYDRYDRGYDRYDRYDRSRSRSYTPSRRYKY